MIEPPAQRLDVDRLRSVPMTWEVDPDHHLWLRARFEGSTLHMRLNPGFPDVPLYSVLVDVDETADFDDLPEGWVRMGDLSWPDDAERLGGTGHGSR